MMVGYFLKQILHLQDEFERYTDFYWHLIAIYTWSNEGCIYDVAIHHSFVSRSYRKELSSCRTTLCFSKFDIAHDLVQALCNDKAHAPLLEPFKCPGLRFFFCKHKLARVFPPRQQAFFPEGLPTKEAMTRSAKAITGATNFIAMLRLLNFSY